MKILAVDPGKVTGWAELNATVMKPQAHQLPHFEFLQYAEEAVLWADVVVCENYIITMATLKKSRQTWSLEQIGCLRYWCHQKDVPFVLQSPAEGKQFGTDARLKALNWWHPGQQHANDALRHLLLYAVRHQLVAADELL